MSRRHPRLTSKQIAAARSFPVFYSIFNPIFPAKLRQEKIDLTDSRTSPPSRSWIQRNQQWTQKCMAAWDVMEKQTEKA